MCLDVVRALSREARLVEALISDLTEMSDGCSILTGSSRTSMWTLSCHARWPCDETGSFSMNLIAAFDGAVRKVHSARTRVQRLMRSVKALKRHRQASTPAGWKLMDSRHRTS
jgi:hypothetical protein